MLRATGYVRPVDELGRVVLPVSVRQDLGVEPKDDVEAYVYGNSIVLASTFPAVCSVKDKIVCRACAEALGAFNRHQQGVALGVVTA